MPVIQQSTYHAPAGFSNGHLQTLYSVFRKVKGVSYRHERIETPDGDFLDLDWSKISSKKIAILSHGLEGNTLRHYILGMVKTLNRNGWDAVAWNFRGCSGEPNRKLRWYHSGETGDLNTVIRHVAGKNEYSRIALIGFSLGGNITLKYLGELSSEVPDVLRGAVTYSVPCDLKSSALKLARPSAKIYMWWFLRSLHRKIRTKMQSMPGLIDDTGFQEIRNFVEFDNRYTAPVHGFKDAFDYFSRCSSRQFLSKIRVPVLLVNAKNDPFLDDPSYPYEEAVSSSCFHLEVPESGGHTGFVTFGNNGEYWSESRALIFLEENTG